MLTTREIQAHLERIQYKSGWDIRVYDGAWEGQHIVITSAIEDAYDTSKIIVLDIHTSLPPMPDLDYFEQWLAWRLIRIESHEAREFLRRDGSPIFDPHAEYADRDLWPDGTPPLPG